jgi:hypothetical protein
MKNRRNVKRVKKPRRFAGIASCFASGWSAKASNHWLIRGISKTPAALPDGRFSFATQTPHGRTVSIAKKWTGDPWMPAPKYAATLRGLGINLMVTNIPTSVSFTGTVFSAQCVYSDPDFAVRRLGDMEWMLHADHTYDKHPLVGFVANIDGRGSFDCTGSTRKGQKCGRETVDILY